MELLPILLIVTSLGAAICIAIYFEAIIYRRTPKNGYIHYPCWYVGNEWIQLDALQISLYKHPNGSFLVYDYKKNKTYSCNETNVSYMIEFALKMRHADE